MSLEAKSRIYSALSRTGAQVTRDRRHRGTFHAERVPDACLAAAVASKIEDGNLKAAIRILCSDDSVAPCTSDVADQLRAKHPPATMQGASQLSDISEHEPLTLTEESVYKAIRSFPAGSAGGPNGLRPQHLIDLIGCKESGHDLVP